MKKKISSIILTAAALIAVLMLTPFSASADEKITVNGQEVSKGDTVTFEYYLSGIEDAVEGIGSFIEYDSKSLEYVEGSIGFDVLNNAMYNLGEGEIYFSAINVIDGYDIKDEKLIVTLSFKVLDSAKGSISITNTIDELFTLVNEDVDLTPDEYKERESLTVNTYEENTAPYLGFDANDVAQYFDISSDDNAASKLEEYFEGNRNEKVLGPKTIAPNSADTPDEESVSEASVTTGTNSEAADTGASESNEKENSGKTAVIAIIIVFVVLVIGAAAFLVLGRKKNDK